MRGFVWKSARDTSKGQVHCSEDPKWWGELRGFDKLLGALTGFVRTVYHPCICQSKSINLAIVCM